MSTLSSISGYLINWCEAELQKVVEISVLSIPDSFDNITPNCANIALSKLFSGLSDILKVNSASKKWPSSSLDQEVCQAYSQYPVGHSYPGQTVIYEQVTAHHLVDGQLLDQIESWVTREWIGAHSRILWNIYLESWTSRWTCLADGGSTRSSFCGRPSTVGLFSAKLSSGGRRSLGALDYSCAMNASQRVVVWQCCFLEVSQLRWGVY